MKLRERIEAVLSFQDVTLNLDAVAPEISDYRVIERIAGATHKDGRRCFVSGDRKINWLSY